MSDVAADLKQKSVTAFKGALNQQLVLVVLSYYFGISGVRSQVNSQGNQLFADNVLRAVNYELVNQRNALSVGKCGFELVLLTKVVQQLQD